MKSHDAYHPGTFRLEQIGTLLNSGLWSQCEEEVVSGDFASVGSVPTPCYGVSSGVTLEEPSMDQRDFSSSSSSIYFTFLLRMVAI